MSPSEGSIHETLADIIVQFQLLINKYVQLDKMLVFAEFSREIGQIYQQPYSTDINNY